MNDLSPVNDEDAYAERIPSHRCHVALGARPRPLHRCTCKLLPVLDSLVNPPHWPML